MWQYDLQMRESIEEDEPVAILMDFINTRKVVAVLSSGPERRNEDWKPDSLAVS